MTTCKLAVLLVILVALLCHSTTYGGPSRSYALTNSRGSKIPRAIRAPFRNPQMMTARGFGKRTPLGKYKESDALWSTAKQDGKLFEDMVNDNELISEDNLRERDVESFPVEWLATEIASNPSLAKTILHRFVDTNRDGLLSARELLFGTTNLEESPDMF